jgi:L-arabinonolactonase
VDVEVAVNSMDILGEGPVWSRQENALYWVDIDRQLLQRLNPNTGERKMWKMHSNIGSFALRPSGHPLVALRDGFFFYDLDTSKTRFLGDPEDDLPYTRFNDGKCDRMGRFWAGTMDEESPKKRAALYCLSPDRTYTKMIDHIGISNGLGWSPDNSVFYYTDSVDHTIYAYDFNLTMGTISNPRVFARTPNEYVPDGLTVDKDGFVWSANWDGWKVIRYTPDGKIDMEILLPVQRPTSCTFGGPNMDQLFITSARIDLDVTALEKQPLAGSVFVIQTQSEGIAEPFFNG